MNARKAQLLSRPWAVAIMAGLTFFIFTQAILITQTLISGAKLTALSPTDTISLISGTITAAGLVLVYTQILDNDHAARRRSTLHLDALHEHFNSKEMRHHRNLAYVYLKFLIDSPGALHGYARYWILDTPAGALVPTPEYLRGLSGAVPGEPHAYEDLESRKFMEYDSAVSAVVGFYARLSACLRQDFPEVVESEAQLDDAASEAFGPFFWSYWQDRLVALGNECKSIHDQKTSCANIRPPFFIEHFQRLEKLLGTETFQTAKEQPTTQGMNNNS